MILRSCIAAAASLLVLAGCGKSDDSKAGNEAATAPGVAPGTASSASIQPGQWEVVTETVRFDAPNMPKQIAAAMMANRNKTSRICITAKDLQSASGNLFTGKKNKNCSRQEFTFAGGRVRGRMSCSGGDTPGQVELEVDGVYTPTTYATTSKMRMSGGGMAMNIEANGTGRRIGECPAGSEG
jgi:hypothetical protein